MKMCKFFTAFACSLAAAGYFVPGARGGEGPSASGPEARTVRVAVFEDQGAPEAKVLGQALAEDSGLEVETLKAEDIRSGALDRFDVLIHPGGSGGKQGKALGEEGREKVRSFVKRGGGYVGICAGAYLASSDYSWSLHVLDAKVVDKKHWARGHGPVEVRLSPEGQSALGSTTDRPVIIYYQGPLLAPADQPDLPDYEALGLYEGEIAKKGAPKGVMRGTTAIARAPFGSGRVICFSPHPEKTAELHGMVHRGVRWAAGR